MTISLYSVSFLHLYMHVSLFDSIYLFVNYFFLLIEEFGLFLFFNTEKSLVHATCNKFYQSSYGCTLQKKKSLIHLWTWNT